MPWCGNPWKSYRNFLVRMVDAWICKFVKGDRWFLGGNKLQGRHRHSVDIFRTYCIFETETIVGFGNDRENLKVETMKSQQDLKTDRSFISQHPTSLQCHDVMCHCRCSFWDVPPFIPLDARASKRYGPSSWKLLQPLLRTMRCFSQSLQMQEERFYMDISSGGGPQGNCQQVDAWIFKIAFLSSLWGHCVWGPIQFLQGVLLKTT